MLFPWKYLQKSVPLFAWSRDYNIDKAVSDLVAGITVGLTLIPQSIAYASLAGLAPQYGLYSSLCGGLIYVFFGTIPELSIAPTALLSLLTISYTKNLSFGNVHGAILLCFLAGCVELLCGIVHLGFLVDFVSSPVVSAFTSASAITIASSQVKNLIGVKFEGETFYTIWKNVFEHITELKLADTILGLSCCAVLLFMRKLKDYGAPLIDSGKKQSTFKKMIWLFSVAKNALVVVCCAAAAFVLDYYNETPFTLTGRVPTGWPNVSLPLFYLEKGNTTITFKDMLYELETGIIFVPFIAILANIGIAKAFAKGKAVDASQEMIAVGLCNIVGSVFGSYPVNASFSRAAVGSSSGIRTPLAGVYTAAMVFLAFTLLTPYFPYIPKTTLAAVIICAVIFMVELMIAQRIWKTNKLDLFPFTITFICCLVIGIEMGILIGILVDIIKVLYVSARPKVSIDQIIIGTSPGYVRITILSSMPFFSAEYVRETVLKEDLLKIGTHQYVVIDLGRIESMDYTAVMCMGELIKDLKNNEKKVFLLLDKEYIINCLKGVCGKDLVICATEWDLQNSISEHQDASATSLAIDVRNEVEKTTKL
ncbi:unnamed protein product [Phaedon cochleariae]|uniref:STAS domain-containing protein n=1 Tax=Phaedon cochleariae TaxID=80249 RepID=A0A9N9SK88_PHACE|nr:unnamed protein product [Phaedon cochleariae]